MSKIYFDRDGVMIGIHKKTNKLHKKEGHLWDSDKWSLDIVNEQENLIDIIHDYDGCIIGLTPTGLVKQKETGFLSTFYPYTIKFKSIIREPTSFDEIIKARCGFFPRFDELEDIEHLDKEFKDLIRFKKVQKNKCKDRSNMIRNAFRLNYENKNNEILNRIEKRNKTIQDLESQVIRLQQTL